MYICVSYGPAQSPSGAFKAVTVVLLNLAPGRVANTTPALAATTEAAAYEAVEAVEEEVEAKTGEVCASHRTAV